jgi:hypothetical protein
MFEEQVDEMGELQVIDGDLGLALTRDDQVLLYCLVQLQVPCRDALKPGSP